MRPSPKVLCALLLFIAGCRSLDLPDAPGPASVSGRTIDPAGVSAALPSVRVRIEGSSLGTLTDSDGLFRLAPLPAGRYSLSLQLEPGDDGTPGRGLRRAVSLAEGQQLSLGDVPLRGTGELQGRVTRDGQLSGNAGILVYVAGTAFQTLTGDDGTYRLPDLPEGTFRLGAQSDGYGPQQQTVETSAGEVTQARSMDLRPAPARRVVVEGVLELVNAPDGATARLALFAVGTTEPLAEVQTSAGAFSFGEVPAGLYRLEASGAGLRGLRLDGVAAQGERVSLGTLRIFGARPDDLDGDGTSDAADDDRDGDGVPNADDAFPDDPDEHADFDGDGLGDASDLDDDADGLLDAEELALGVDGVLTNPLDLDSDDDGVNDLPDTCRAIANPDQADADGDGRGDLCDADRDGDAIPDALDNCPATANPTQIDQDADRLGDVCDGDVDGDGAQNLADNCVAFANADQKDLDADGQGDACDSDADGDGVPNSLDLCPSIADPTQADLDRDRLGDACDLDLDGDGVTNALDTCERDFNPLQDDLDADRQGDVCDADVDGDSVANATDNCTRTWNQDQADDDTDRVGNVCDADWVPPASIVPVITSFSPASGNPGDTVTLQGQNFEPNATLNVVDFNGVPATVTSATQTTLTVQVPPGASTGAIRLRTRAASTQSSTAFIVVRPITITDVQPRSFDAGATLTLYGANFETTALANVVRATYVDGGTWLTDGGVATLQVLTASELLLTVQAPTTAPASVPLALSVTKLGAPTASSLPITVSQAPQPPPPTISGFTPNASLAGGPVVIRGTGFGTSTSAVIVKFTGPNSTQLTATVSAVSPTQLNTQVPSGAVTGPFTVTTPFGTATSPQVMTIDPQNPSVLTESGPTIFLPDAGASESERTYTITGQYLLPMGSLRLGDGTLVPALDGGTSVGAQFVLPEPWVTGPITYVRGDGIEAAMQGKLRTGRFTGTQAINPVPDLWYQRADRARYYGNVGKLIYTYDGATLAVTNDPPFDDGTPPTVLETTPQGLILRTNNGYLNTANRTRVTTPVPSGRVLFPAAVTSPRCECIFAVTETSVGLVISQNRVIYDLEAGTTSAPVQVTSQYNFGFQYAGPFVVNPVNNAAHYLHRSNIGTAFTAQGLTATASFFGGQFPAHPGAGYWTDDSGTHGGAGGTLFMGPGWTVTLPEPALFVAGLPSRSAAVVLGATKLMVVDLARRSVSAMPFTPNGTLKGLYKEWDRDELVIRTDHPTQTLTRLTIDGP